MKTPEELQAMRDDLAAGLSTKEIATKHRVTYQVAMRLLQLGQYKPGIDRRRLHSNRPQPTCPRPYGPRTLVAARSDRSVSSAQPRLVPGLLGPSFRPSGDNFVPP